MKILDANMILRYMVQDDPEKAEQVKQLLKSEKVMGISKNHWTKTGKSSIIKI